MITINPNDFSNDKLYTKMEELNGKLGSISPVLENVQKDIMAVEKYLKELKLAKKMYLYDIGDGQDEDFYPFGWDNKDKRLVAGIVDIRNYTQEFRHLIECKLPVRLACHAKLSKLIDLIINSIGDNDEIVG